MQGCRVVGVPIVAGYVRERGQRATHLQRAVAKRALLWQNVARKNPSDSLTVSLRSKEVYTSLKIIDAHLHLWPDGAANESANHGNSTMHAHHGPPPDLTATIESYLDLMQAHGVSHAAIVQPSFLGFDHSYISKALRDHPGRFVGIGLIDPVAPEVAGRLESLIGEDGLSGVRLRPYMFRAYGLADRRCLPLWEKACELRVPLCIYMEWTQAAGLERMLAQFPDVPVVIDHCGLPDLSAEKKEISTRAILRLAEYTNTFIKVSGQYSFSKSEYPYANTRDLMSELLKAFGADRMMWGTNFPLILQHEGYGGALDLIRNHYDFLTDEDREWILGGTAARVWNFSKD